MLPMIRRQSNNKSLLWWAGDKRSLQLMESRGRVGPPSSRPALRRQKRAALCWPRVWLITLGDSSLHYLQAADSAVICESSHGRPTFVFGDEISIDPFRSHGNWLRPRRRRRSALPGIQAISRYSHYVRSLHTSKASATFFFLMAKLIFILSVEKPLNVRQSSSLSD